MFGIDDQMLLLSAWNDMALDCMAAATQVSTAMLGLGSCTSSSAGQSRVAAPSISRSQSPASSRTSGRSWYRAPERDPFEVSWFGMTWPFPTASMMPFAAPPSQFALQPFRYWADLLRPAPAMPFNWLNLWSPGAWPATAMLPWTAGTGCAALAAASLAQPVSTATPFATYRSDSGHAVAQITFPNQMVAAVALPATAVPLLDTLLAWSRMLH